MKESIKICTKNPQKYLWKDDSSTAKFYSIPWIIAVFTIFLIFYAIEGLSSIWVDMWVLLVTTIIGWGVYFGVMAYRKILRLRRRICYNATNKKLLVIRKKDEKIILEVDIKDIRKVITSPYEDGLTLIISDKQITPWSGISYGLQYAGGDFGLRFCEEFKKYWESRGYQVSVEKKKSWIFGERIVYERSTNAKKSP